ncbi:MAG: DUF4469 domain-containing protein [Tannerellaceae bacterium]|jgi:hypothetical protein|nr:DUF4469 domain-containing protein [Tannerellaceae bacterium]
MNYKKPEFYIPPLDASPAEQPIPAPPDKASIASVDNVVNNKHNSITPGHNVIISGIRIKITPDDEIGLGVFFIPCSGEPPVLAPNPPETNDRNMLTVKVPETLPEGEYLVRIITRYSGTNLLKYHRSIDYDKVLTCKKAK